MKKHLSLFYFGLLAVLLSACGTSKKAVSPSSPGHMSHLEYVRQYKEAAIKNMHEKLVPASITLAQGILESGGGNSWLAQKANNHFGIKCGSDWNGPSVRHDDNRKGECFRKYASAYGSYADHAEFLRSRSWYAPLFELNITDYKGWAKGLKKAGYATDRRYPDKLIDIIERYELYKYDRM